MFSINEFRSQLVGGGARPTLFQVQITNPITGIADFKIPFMVKTASLPSSTVGQYEVPYMGRKIKYGGDRTFEDWTVTVINDEDFLIRNSMEAWSNAINTFESNARALPQIYKSDAQVIQYGKDQTPLRQYTFQGLFPTNISEISLGWEQNDSIEEFTVTFAYDAYTVDGGITGMPLT
ncbi:MAG: phage tail protein [Anaerolineaceae bacterium]